MLYEDDADVNVTGGDLVTEREGTDPTEGKGRPQTPGKPGLKVKVP